MEEEGKLNLKTNQRVKDENVILFTLFEAVITELIIMNNIFSVIVYYIYLSLSWM